MTRYRDDRFDNRNNQGNQNRDWQNRDWNGERSHDDRSGMGQSYGMGGDMGRGYSHDELSHDMRGMNWDDRQGMGYGQDDARSYSFYGSQGMGGQGYSQRYKGDRSSQGRFQGQSGQGYGMDQGRYGSDLDRSYGARRGSYDWEGLRQAGQQGQGQYGQGQYGVQRYGSQDYGNQRQGMGDQYGTQSGQQSYRGRGPSGYQRSDERIKEQVNEALEDDDQVDAENITVQLQNGEATLTGTVNNRFQKRAAEDCVERVRGVKDVHNQLRVQYSNQGGTQGRSNQSGTGNQSQTSRTGNTNNSSTNGTTSRTAKS